MTATSVASATRSPLMSVQDVAAYIGVSRFTVSRWLNDPCVDFPAPARVGRQYRWRQSEIEGWLDDTKASAASVEQPARRRREVRL